MPTAPPRILVIEDAEAIRDALAVALTQAGYAVEEHADGQRLNEVVGAFRPDLVVLDVMLPGRDGFALAGSLRARGDTMPLLFLTARDAVADRLAGFSAGADDYLVKPFHIDELLARVRALLRRSGRLTSAAWQVGLLVVDPDAHEVRVDGHEVGLTATEFKLLQVLGEHRGRVLSKLQLLTQVWGYEDYDPNVVEVNVSALRRKLETHGPRVLHTVRGVGYVVRSP